MAIIISIQRVALVIQIYKLIGLAIQVCTERVSLAILNCMKFNNGESVWKELTWLFQHV